MISFNYISKLKKYIFALVYFVYVFYFPQKTRTSPTNITFHYQRIIIFFTVDSLPVYFYIYISLSDYFDFFKEVFQSFMSTVVLIFNNFGSKQRHCFKMNACSRSTQKLYHIDVTQCKESMISQESLSCERSMFIDCHDGLSRSGQLKNHSFSPHFLNDSIKFS